MRSVFKIIEGDAELFITRLNAAVKDGWSPHGNMNTNAKSPRDFESRFSMLLVREADAEQ